MIVKRYQYWSNEGIKWTDWFIWEGPEWKYQLGKKLKNEYKEIKVKNEYKEDNYENLCTSN